MPQFYELFTSLKRRVSVIYDDFMMIWSLYIQLGKSTKDWKFSKRTNQSRSYNWTNKAQLNFWINHHYRRVFSEIFWITWEFISWQYLPIVTSAELWASRKLLRWLWTLGIQSIIFWRAGFLCAAKASVWSNLLWRNLDNNPLTGSMWFAQSTHLKAPTSL